MPAGLDAIFALIKAAQLAQQHMSKQDEKYQKDMKQAMSSVSSRVGDDPTLNTTRFPSPVDMFPAGTVKVMHPDLTYVTNKALDLLPPQIRNFLVEHPTQVLVREVEEEMEKSLNELFFGSPRPGRWGGIYIDKLNSAYARENLPQLHSSLPEGNTFALVNPRTPVVQSKGHAPTIGHELVHAADDLANALPRKSRVPGLSPVYSEWPWPNLVKHSSNLTDFEDSVNREMLPYFLTNSPNSSKITNPTLFNEFLNSTYKIKAPK